MLLVAAAREVRVSKCFPLTNLLTKRRASLTGAIQRGARKARDVGERAERYNSKFKSTGDTTFRSDDARFPPQTEQFEKPFVKRWQSDFEQVRQELVRESRGDQAGRSRYLREDRQAYSRDRKPDEHVYQKKEYKPSFNQGYDTRSNEQGDSRYPRKEASWIGRGQQTSRSFAQKEGSLDEGQPRRDFKRDAVSDTRYPRKEASWTGQGRQMTRPFIEKEGGLDGDQPRREYKGGVISDTRYPRKEALWTGQARQTTRLFTPKEEGSDEDQRRRDLERLITSNTGYPKKDDYGVTQNEPPSKRYSPKQEKRSSFSRKPNEYRSSSSYSTTDEADRNFKEPKSFARQRSSGEEEGNEIQAAEQSLIAMRRHVEVPLSIPRNSAASEFIFGTSAVKAALQAGNRKLYQLYIYQGTSETEQREGDEVFFKLAHKLGLKVKLLGPNEMPLLNKMAQGRPHNGYVLEASQLPSTPAQALDRVTSRGDGFSFTPGHQTMEDIAVNGTSHEIPGNGSRYPFVLMLDSIKDPGNLGAIIRSAAFFGIDAIVWIDNNHAPFSAITLKASSGAAEHMRYLKVKNDHDFVKRSRGNGWKFFAAVAPESASASRTSPKTVRLKEAEEALMKGPCVLILGGEGDGLRPRLQKAADVMVGIPRAGGLSVELGLDSLNVSVAAALMMQIFLRASNAEADEEVSAEVRERSEVNEQLF